VLRFLVCHVLVTRDSNSLAIISECSPLRKPRETTAATTDS